jgi:uncharacterized coiled-coil protein SlyX
MVRIIRRYPNRKLYDVQNSCYVSLKKLHELVVSGARVRVEDSVSGRDLTAVTMARLRLVEAEQAVERLKQMPEAVFRGIGDGIDGFLSRLGRAEGTLNGLRDHLTGPQGQLARLTQQLEALTDQVAELEARLDAVDAQRTKR